MAFQPTTNSGRGSRGLRAVIASAALVVAIAASAMANDINTSTGMTLAGGPLAMMRPFESRWQ